MDILPVLLCDSYKLDHKRQYPVGTEMIYSNLTPRMSRIGGINKVVMFGLQYFLQEYLIDQFDHNFFRAPIKQVINQYQRRIDSHLGKNAIPIDNIAELHDLGHLPIQIKALQEGTRCPLRVPLLTITNTHPKFFWLTNFLETILCNSIWQAITTATICYEYRQILDFWANTTSDMPEFVKYQGHDFSMRGMSSLETSCISGMAHLLNFVGTDTLPAVDYLEEYYGANSETEIVGCSIPASEHSCMSVGGVEGEADIYRRFLTEVYPAGPVSIVSDTYDYWRTLNVTIREMKDLILSRNGKFIVRPDSGCPVKITCGDLGSTNELEKKGSIRVLWEIFGGRENSKGFKQLDDHVGYLYGDSITMDRCRLICGGLYERGFASTNVALGIGSYSLQHNTRDTFGLAMKATHAIVNGKRIDIYKDPKTDDGTKKSAKGLLMVYPSYDSGSYGDLKLFEQVTPEQEQTGCLQTVFLNGKITNRFSLSEIRSRLHGNKF